MIRVQLQVAADGMREPVNVWLAFPDAKATDFGTAVVVFPIGHPVVVGFDDQPSMTGICKAVEWSVG